MDATKKLDKIIDFNLAMGLPKEIYLYSDKDDAFGILEWANSISKTGVSYCFTPTHDKVKMIIYRGFTISIINVNELP